MESANLTNFSRPIFVIGSQGLVGTALARSIHLLNAPFAEQHFYPIAFQKSPDFANTVHEQIARFPDGDIIIATGLTNPALDQKQLEFANFLQVQEIIKLCHSDRHRFITLGSIFETFPEVCAKNHYLQSKLQLSQWIQSQTGNFHIRHLRLHTLYGGHRQHLKEYMFLGQIAKSLSTASDFKMSSGEQLREYHHVDDIARGVLGGLQQDWHSSRIIEVNSGKPLQLKNLALELFKTFGRLESLHLGALPSIQGENMSKVFQPNFDYAKFQFREPLAGVKEWFTQIL